MRIPAPVRLVSPGDPIKRLLLLTLVTASIITPNVRAQDARAVIAAASKAMGNDRIDVRRRAGTRSGKALAAVHDHQVQRCD
jgi:hypothetical protein